MRIDALLQAQRTAFVADLPVPRAAVGRRSIRRQGVAGSNARKIPLHIVRHVTDAMTLMREGIFGPILPIVRYDGIDNASPA